MKTELDRLYAGTMTFARFYETTRPEWEAIAGQLTKRWGHHGSVGQDDLVQEMMAEVAVKLREWDPAKAPLLSYIVFNATAAAKRAIHRARGACRYSDKAPSRAAQPISSFARPGTPALTADDLGEAQPPNQLDVDAIVDAHRLARSEVERSVMDAIVKAVDVDGEVKVQRGAYDAAAMHLAKAGYTGDARNAVTRYARVFAHRAAS